MSDLKKNNWELDRVIKLSKEVSDSLTNTPLRVAKRDFIELERWRNRSLKSKIRIN